MLGRCDDAIAYDTEQHLPPNPQLAIDCLFDKKNVRIREKRRCHKMPVTAEEILGCASGGRRVQREADVEA